MDIPASWCMVTECLPEPEANCLQDALFAQQRPFLSKQLPRFRPARNARRFSAPRKRASVLPVVPGKMRGSWYVPDEPSSDRGGNLDTGTFSLNVALGSVSLLSPPSATAEHEGSHNGATYLITATEATI